ncbi:MAG: DUF2357 domain-containing protein [Ruminococcaceae bacterium]|nr:DUF2357 domain-containing protein [Oscillospiraceae bacterium]
MDQLDLYYRAFLDYRKLTAQDKESARQRDIISHSNNDADKLEAIKYFCNINEDWINEIEAGLVFVEKAIHEERQFIRNDGEVVPIEKTKHVDKHSVEHLARHSDLISRKPEDGSDDITPDKLYMIERESDYAVYENRFLYMLLKYVESFIDIRLSRIQELGNTYRASMSMKKSISIGKRHINYELALDEERRNDPYALLNDEAQALVHRMEGLEHWVDALLRTPLMEQVAKVAMIRPPITKTNVLRMDNNFKKAVALYEYVSSYEGDGYTIEEVKKVWNPFTDTMGDELSEIVMLSSFLTYEYGNDLKEILAASYAEEEERRRKLEEEKLVSQIAALKKRIADSGESPEAYMLMLERRNKMLESDSAMLVKVTEEKRLLTEEIRSLEKQCEVDEMRISALEENVAEKKREIDALNVRYETDMAALRKAHAEAVEALVAEHEATVNALNEEHSTQMRTIRETCEKTVADARREAEEKVRATMDATRAEIKSVRDECERKTGEVQTNAAAEVEKYAKETERVTKANHLMRGQLNGLRHKYGLIPENEDFSSKERFKELEEEFAAFYELFEDEWKKTRKRIRKDILWTFTKNNKNNSPKSE